MKYSLRQLFLIVLVLALILGVGIPVYDRLTFDPVVDAVTHLRRLNPKLIKFYDNNEWRGEYASVDLSGASLSEGDLTYVRKINPMGEINLSRTNVTDDNLWELYGTMASRIDLTATEVTDEGIAKLRSAIRKNCLIVK